MDHFDKIIEIIENVLDIEAGVLNQSSTMNDTAGWDSISFIDVLLALESGFNVQFSTLESATLTSVEAINRVLCNKLQS